MKKIYLCYLVLFLLVLFLSSKFGGDEQEELHYKFSQLDKLSFFIKDYFNGKKEGDISATAKEQTILFMEKLEGYYDESIKLIDTLNNDFKKILEINIPKYEKILDDLDNLNINFDIQFITASDDERKEFNVINKSITDKKILLRSKLDMNQNLFEQK